MADEGIVAKLSGVSFYQENLKDLKEGEELDFVEEPNNQFDRNAIRVCSKAGKTIGYMKRDSKVRDYIKKYLHDVNYGIKATICLVYGHDKGTIGVTIRIMRCLKDLYKKEVN